MKKNFNQYLQDLSPQSRKNVDARAAEILSEEMGLQDVDKPLQDSQEPSPKSSKSSNASRNLKIIDQTF